MEIFKVNLRIRDCMDKEWMLSNGIGGYSMQTISSSNTRSYHGLLVASLNPPLNRNVILSNILEDVYIEGEHFNLSTMMNTEYISEGYKYLNKFKYKFGPEMEYKIVREIKGKEKNKTEEIYINKKIQMEYLSNTVVIEYDVHAASEDVYLDLTPLLNYRDFHSVNSDLDLFQKVSIDSEDENNKNKKKEEVKVKYNITNTNNNFNENNPKTINLFMTSSLGSYEIINKKYKDLNLFREKERGFLYKEDLLMPGKFKIKVDKNTSKKIYITASLDNYKDNPKEIFEKEEKRKKEIIKKSKLKLKTKINKKTEEEKEFEEDLALASDYFLVKRDDKKTIMAGYPWFADWGRDSIISLEGLLLKTKRYDDAKLVLDSLAKNLTWGLIPNSFDEYSKKPLFNSADSSLLYINALKTYLNYTGDEKYIKKNLEKAREIVKLYEKGTDYDNNNIYEDIDGLLNTGREYTQNTWMDAKIGDIVVTPRNGKAVEMNSLWYNARKVLAEFEEKFGSKEKAKELNEKAEKTKKAFLREFKSNKKGLKDLIDSNEVRPNQLFSMWTNYEIVDPKSDLANEIIEVCDRRLRNRFGLKSLEKGYPYYIGEYSGNSFKRDMSYHQGVSWVWLLELYYEALRKRAEKTKNKKDIKKYEDFLEETKKTYMKNLYQKPCVMSINEINDSTFPYDGKGAISQAWSVGAIIKILCE